MSQTVPHFVLCFRGRKQTYNGPTMVSVVCYFLQLVIDLDLTYLCWVTVIYFCSPEEDIWPRSPIVALPHTGYDQTKVTDQCLLFNLKFNQSQLVRKMNVLIWALVTHSVWEPCWNQWFTIVCALLVLYPEGSIDGADLSEIDARLQALQDYMRDLDTGH